MIPSNLRKTDEKSKRRHKDVHINMALEEKNGCSLQNYKRHICDSQKTDFKPVSSRKAEDPPILHHPPTPA